MSISPESKNNDDNFSLEKLTKKQLSDLYLNLKGSGNFSNENIFTSFNKRNFSNMEILFFIIFMFISCYALSSTFTLWDVYDLIKLFMEKHNF